MPTRPTSPQASARLLTSTGAPYAWSVFGPTGVLPLVVGKGAEAERQKLAEDKPQNMAGKGAWTFAPASAAFLSWQAGNVKEKRHARSSRSRRKDKRG